MMSFSLDIEGESHNGERFLEETTSLDQIYPDIQGELCSRHSALYGRLKNQFQSLYDKFEPECYIVLNHVGEIVLSNSANTQQPRASFALENGLIFLVKKTYLGEDIFINSNGFGLKSEVVLDCKGKFKPQETQKNLSTICSVQEITEIVEIANESLSLTKLFGAVIYVYCNVCTDLKNIKEKLLLGLYLSILKVNGLLHQTSLQEMMHNLRQKLQSNFIEQQLFGAFEKRTISLSGNGEEWKLSKQKKLIFYKIPESMKEPNDYKADNFLSNNKGYQIDDFFERLEGEKQENTAQKKPIYQLAEQWSLPNFASFQNSYLVSYVNGSSCHQLLRKMRKHYQASVESQQNNTEENPEMEKRFGAVENIDQCMFTSACSVAVAVLNPQEEMWFK